MWGSWQSVNYTTSNKYVDRTHSKPATHSIPYKEHIYCSQELGVSFIDCLPRNYALKNVEQDGDWSLGDVNVALCRGHILQVAEEAGSGTLTWNSNSFGSSLGPLVRLGPVVSASFGKDVEIKVALLTKKRGGIIGRAQHVSSHRTPALWHTSFHRRAGSLTSQ